MFRVSVDLDNDLLLQLRTQLAAFSGKNGKKIAPGVSAAFGMAGKLIQKSWQNWAMGGSVEGAADIGTPNARLAGSIKIRRIGDFEASIETDSPYMERIQTGRAEMNMKDPGSPWLTGKKSRVGKDGLPYLIIPFRWGTPGGKGGARAHFGNTIPQEVYALLKSGRFRRSVQNTATKIEKNFRGEDIERHTYSWGDRVGSADAGTDANAAGMVKMKSNPGSTYFTFRVVSAKSKARWVIPAVPANDVVGAVERSTRQEVEDLLHEGLEQDLLL